MIHRHRLASGLLTSVVLLGSACKEKAATTTTTGTELPPPHTAAAQKDAALDRQLIDFMVPQQEQTILMSKKAIERAEHPEVKELASRLIAEQEPSNVQLKAWRHDWFGSDATPAWNTCRRYLA